MSIGYQFPFQISSGSVGYFQMTNSELEAVKSNLRVLILTNWGERPMSYNFGCNLREFLFEQLDDDNLGEKIADRIIQQVNKWMPFINLVTLNVIFPSQDTSLQENSFSVKMSFKMNSNPTETVSQVISL